MPFLLGLDVPKRLGVFHYATPPGGQQRIHRVPVPEEDGWHSLEHVELPRIVLAFIYPIIEVMNSFFVSPRQSTSAAFSS